MNDLQRSMVIYTRITGRLKERIYYFSIFSLVCTGQLPRSRMPSLKRRKHRYLCKELQERQSPSKLQEDHGLSTSTFFLMSRFLLLPKQPEKRRVYCKTSQTDSCGDGTPPLLRSYSVAVLVELPKRCLAQETEIC